MNLVQGFILLVFCLGQAHALAQVHRTDIQESLGALACKTTSSNPQPTPSDLWAAGVYDAGIAFYLVKPLNHPQQVGSQEDYAKSLAQKSHHQGYALGTCQGKEQLLWIATMPAAFASGFRNQVIVLEHLALKQYCESYRIDYAHAHIGAPKKLFGGEPKDGPSGPPQTVRLQLNLFDAGTVSLTCKPYLPKAMGAVLWALYPVKEGPLLSPVLANDLEPSKPLEQALAAWVNSLRAQSGYRPLASHPSLQDAAALLVTGNDTVMHDREQLKKAGQLISASRGDFLGENRVKAQSPQEAAWLLWNSPRHRSLILSTKATHFDLSSKQSSDGAVTVMVFGAF